jgi:hypothetical protein
MRTLPSSIKLSSVLVLSLLLEGLTIGTAAPSASAGGPAPAPSSPSPVVCEDFAQRQIQLADRLLQQSKYSRALKVLNSTAENCNIEPVREKLVEVLGEWYGSIRGQGSGALKRFLNILSNQAYVDSATKSQFEERIGARVRVLVNQEFSGENFRAAYRLCRNFPEYVSENFKAEYQCGTAAQEVGVESVTMASYQWLIQNWSEDQSLASWQEVASPLEKLYFLNGRFQEAYQLARQRARRDPSPEAILSSLVSVRGKFLSPVLRAGALFYGDDPSSSAASLVRDELQRINFPTYVKAFYILSSEGGVERGMYGEEANQPSASLLQQAENPVSLLQSPNNSSRVWLVSPVDDRFLVLEFNVATTPEENVRLETVYENIENDEEWKKLYNLEFTETSPATGSALGTLLSGASLDDQNLAAYDDLFDASSLLAYYCIQNGDGGIDESHNFDRANVAYGDSEWDRTSNTPALYHHSIEYSGQSVREVVWPKFVDEEWTGVVRVGLTHS